MRSDYLLKRYLEEGSNKDELSKIYLIDMKKEAEEKVEWYNLSKESELTE